MPTNNEEREARLRSFSLDLANDTVENTSTNVTFDELVNEGIPSYIGTPGSSLYNAEEGVVEEIPQLPNGVEFDYPFIHTDGEWYVVFENRIGGVSRFYSPEFVQYYSLRRFHPTLFPGFENVYTIQWLPDAVSMNSEPEYDEDYYPEDEPMIVNDGYSVERDENPREVIPLLATNIGREVPLVSFEQEFSGDGDKVSRILHDAGICYSPYADGYHLSEGRRLNNETDRICYVETDSSCGYELIFDRLNLSNRSVAEKVAEAQRIMRRLKDEDSIRLSARCGFHIHVDVSNWGMKEIVSAYHLWNYLEDPIFRFASAFWSSHRDEEVGGGYSTPVPKGETQRAGIANRLYERRDALNFTHILRAKANCNCGAYIYEDWANCQCNLRQPTLEFRVFNATLNQRKIRAYAAFCVGFVNAAKNTEFDPTVYPEMRWRGTQGSTSMIGWEFDSEERIKFILDNFPLTNVEKSDIVYCMKNSSLEDVVSNL